MSGIIWEAQPFLRSEPRRLLDSQSPNKWFGEYCRSRIYVSPFHVYLFYLTNYAAYTKKRYSLVVSLSDQNEQRAYLCDLMAIWTSADQAIFLDEKKFAKYEMSHRFDDIYIFNIFLIISLAMDTPQEVLTFLFTCTPTVSQT